MCLSGVIDTARLQLVNCDIMQPTSNQLVHGKQPTRFWLTKPKQKNAAVINIWKVSNVTMVTNIQLMPECS